MNYTPNHHLPQWVKSDRIMMDDFNNAMSSIESGMTANAQAAANAQSTANSARSTANAAQTAANKKPYVVGSYTGTGEEISIDLGFRPSFVIASGNSEFASTNTLQPFSRYGCATGGHVLTNTLLFTSTGFTVPAGHLRCPIMNEPNRVYEYIAFK